MNKPLLIGQLAKLAGVKPDSVRFYERSGLLPKAGRTQSGYRIYDEPALKQLRFIKQAQALGFTLDEIKRILSLRGQGRQTCRCVIAMAEATLTETEQRLTELQRFAHALRKSLARWRTSASGQTMATDFCGLIEATIPSSKKEFPPNEPKRKRPPRKNETL